MKAGLIGPSYMQSSLPFDAQRSINLYIIMDQYGKEPASLYGTPGLKQFGTANSGSGRGTYRASNGRGFFISGVEFCEVFSNGVVTVRGLLPESSGLVTFADNGQQLMVCDGTRLFVFKFSDNSFAQVMPGTGDATGLSTAATITFLDGYFIISRAPNSGVFQISGLYDGTKWAALDFATAESSPDNLIKVINVNGQLWLCGAESTEIWANTGALAFPFQRIAGAKIEHGIASAFAGMSLDSSLYWIGYSRQGEGIVFRADGFSPQRISTEVIEGRLQEAPDKPTLKMHSYQEGGHTFLTITGGGMETALVYDLATQLWHERAYLNEYGELEQPLINDTMFVFDRHLCCSRKDGKIYEQSTKFFDDDGEEIARERTFTHIFDENRRMSFTNLTVGFETGVGHQVNPGRDPQCVLYLSNDGGRTWSGGYQKSLGLAGRFLDRVTFFRLGRARPRTFRVRVTSPNKVCITGAYFNA